MGTNGNGRKQALHFHHPPNRVVSLIPSMTESLFDLGFGDSVVGITDYCIHPADQLQNLPRVGGPKNPRVEDILKLKPDLVLANQEENSRKTVDQLEAEGVPVLVTFPKTVRHALDILWTLTGLYHSQTAAARLESLEFTLEWIQSASPIEKRRFFCPIWQGTTHSGLNWWMTFNHDTYMHDLLDIVGGENVFADRVRHYPLEADLGQIPVQDSGDHDTRYPRVTLKEVIEKDPEMIILPTEPFEFSGSDKSDIQQLMGETAAVRNEQIHLVDGSLLTWHGTRLGKALQELPSLFS